MNGNPILNWLSSKSQCGRIPVRGIGITEWCVSKDCTKCAFDTKSVKGVFVADQLAAILRFSKVKPWT